MTTVQIRRTILSKFGTIYRFSESSGMDQGKLIKFLESVEVIENNEDELEKIKQDANKTLRELYLLVMKTFLQKKIRMVASDYTAIQKNIKEKYGSVRAFCEAHPEFSQSWVYNLCSGRQEYFTPMIEKLMKTLEIQL